MKYKADMKLAVQLYRLTRRDILTCTKVLIKHNNNFEKANKELDERK